MGITRTFYAPDRAAWRGWLEQHYRTEPDIWLVTYRKAAGRPSVGYNDAVEEALCFGWIDSTRKSLDDERLAQRFTPRRPGSPYSQPNRERLRRMLERGAVAEDVLPEAHTVVEAPFIAPADILDALQSDPVGWTHFQRYSDAYRRIRIAYVESTRDRPDEFRKRLDNLIRKNAANHQFGYGIETYY